MYCVFIFHRVEAGTVVVDLSGYNAPSLLLLFSYFCTCLSVGR